MTSVGSGQVTRAEIAEQPAVLARILDEGLPAIREVAEQIRGRDPRLVLFTARGTSDNAALYAKYLVEVLLALPAGLTSPSTTTLYGARPDLRDTLVVSVSQSGESPDLVESTRAARECGALTVAVTNSPDSPLNAESELHLDVLAGPELAVPATKTYTAQLLTLWALVDAWRGGDAEAARGLATSAYGILERADEVATLAARYRFADHLVTSGRGYSYPTAREAALKVMETSFLSAHSYSGADLLHGPLAMVDERTPVIALAPAGPGGEAMIPVLKRIRERGADLCVIGHAARLEQASVSFELPLGCPDTLSPILEILPLQRVAWEIAVARGYDPDQPRGLRKITETR